MKSLAVFAAIGLIGFGYPAAAVLGELESTVADDAASLHSTKVSVTTVSGLKVHQVESVRANVRQYADASGRIYAVTWQGLRHPDLSTLLGTYYSSYKTARDAGQILKNGRLSLTKTKDVVVRLSGMPHRMSGVAYVPALLPQGVHPGDLK
jgi:hypothetical protein